MILSILSIFLSLLFRQSNRILARADRAFELRFADCVEDRLE
jgi:hypothetical protein